MRKKLATFVVLLLVTLAPSGNAECPPEHNYDPLIICRAKCNERSTWCEWSLAHKPTDACYAGDPCTQMKDGSCQCVDASLALF